MSKTTEPRDEPQRNRRETKRYGEYHRDQALRSERQNRQERLREAIQEANRSIARNEYRQAGEVLRDVILPSIRDLDDAKPMSQYHRELHADDEFPWYWSEFSRFRERPDHYVELAGRDPSAGPDIMQQPLTGEATDEDGARRIVERALDTAESITAHHELTNDGMAGEADAMGFHIKLGIHQQDYEMDFGDPVTAVTSRLGALKSLFGGGTSGGKSSGASRQFEDYYQSSVRGGREYKCIDPVGLSTENIAAYDTPQRQNALRHVREQHELPPSFEEIEGYEPKSELLLPLTPDLEDFPLPYDTDAGEWVPKRFTIPASHLSEGLIASVISERVSDSVEDTIRTSYRAIDRDQDDWSLRDLAEEIADRDELTESNKKSAIRVLRNLQEEGFIRTKADEHSLDWDRIFNSSDVITVFNQMPVEDELSRLIIVAYIVDQIWSRRIRPNRYPSLAMWLRELWEIAPHVGLRRKRDDAEQAVVEFIINRLTMMQRKPRDINTHIVADTQDPTDVEKSVRELFNRYIIFSGTAESVIEKVFSWAGQSGHRTLMGTLQDKPGVGGILGAVEPAMGDSNKWGISPVHLTPPSWHHYDKDEVGDGWQKRVEILDDEELRVPEWDVSLPDDLTVDVDIEDGDADDGEDETDDKLSKAALRSNHRAEARERYKKGESLREIARNLDNNPETENSYYASTIGDWCDDLEKGEGVDNDAE